MCFSWVFPEDKVCTGECDQEEKVDIKCVYAFSICVNRFTRCCHRYLVWTVARVTGFWPIEAGEGLTRVRAHLLLLAHQPWLSTLPLSLRCLQGCLHPCAAPLWALPLSARISPPISPSLHPWHGIFSLVFCWSSTVSPAQCLGGLG